MNELLFSAVQSVTQSKGAFCRFLSANDTKATGGHQYGFLLPIAAYPIIFNQEKIKGENIDKTVKIRWQNDLVTDSRMIYYGKAKNELRITRFGNDFPYLNEDHVGDLLIISKQTDDDYEGFVLSTEDDIDTFMLHFNLAADRSNQIIDVLNVSNKQIESTTLQVAIDEAIKDLEDFPQTSEMGKMAQELYNLKNKITDEKVCASPDKILLNWYDTELSMFRSIEEKVYKPIYTKPFADCQSLIEFSNKILNRRKSRAGKSLEHHLSAIFKANRLYFEEQAVTENNKKPDFLFPNSICYHNFEFPADDLTILGAKTTCKDRWRQVINEANRVDEKYLFTLQQGISKNQLKEMADENVKLVVPLSHVDSFPDEYRESLKTLSGFIEIVKEKQERMPKHFFLS
jgi:hypothetical protein